MSEESVELYEAILDVDHVYRTTQRGEKDPNNQKLLTCMEHVQELIQMNRQVLSEKEDITDIRDTYEEEYGEHENTIGVDLLHDAFEETSESLPHHWVATLGRDELLKLFNRTFPKGTSSKDDEGDLPLHWAACHGHLSTVQYLLTEYSKGARIKNDNGFLPLHWAAYSGDEHEHQLMLRLLLAKHPKGITATTDEGYLPIHWAAERGNFAIVQILHEEHSQGLLQPNEDNHLPLYLAIKTYQENITDLSKKRAMKRTIRGMLVLHLSQPDAGNIFKPGKKRYLNVLPWEKKDSLWMELKAHFTNLEMLGMVEDAVDNLTQDGDIEGDTNCPLLIHAAVGYIPIRDIHDLLNTKYLDMFVTIQDSMKRTALVYTIQQASTKENSKHWKLYYKPLIIEIARRSHDMLSMEGDKDDKQVFEMIVSENGRQLIHVAAEAGMPWFGIHDIIKHEFRKSKDSMEILALEDEVTGLVPFMLAGQGKNKDLTTIYSMLQAKPDVLDSNKVTGNQMKRVHMTIPRIQARIRGILIRNIYQADVLQRIESYKKYQKLWKKTLIVFDKNEYLWLKGTDELYQHTWDSIKQQRFDIMRAEDVLDEDIENMREELPSISETLEKATDRVLSETKTSLATEEKEGDVVIVEEVEELADKFSSATQLYEGTELSATQLNQVKLTHDSMKWLRQSDPKYREFFVRRLQQLANGDRSRILAKRLTGSTTTIYETYLEQKSGHRILWTENEKYGLIIWYIAKHKSVSRLMSLIDDAEKRSNRQLTLASNIPEFERDETKVSDDDAENVEEMRNIMLDPLGDTPLKMYEINQHEIQLLSNDDWKPQMHLTKQERGIVQTEGTVCVLGRSGTGKTVCICNRIDYDSNQLASTIKDFSQLFLSRSDRLRNYVKEIVGTSSEGRRDFNTFHELVHKLDVNINSSALNQFLPHQKVTFSRFRKEVCTSLQTDGVDALVVWKNIQSFIKGSIESVQAGRPLTEEEYLDLGKRRCRLSPNQRKSVYTIYERYATFCSDSGSWDECDHITSILQALQKHSIDHSEEYAKLRYSKIYVDEVQDYTQAEIALFFMLSGPSDLFLAGDPAQSIVEGVEFRFEDIRIVGHSLYGQNRRSILEKPKVVNVNFRSHSGILDLAAVVLARLFKVFPDSAKLTRDVGVFHGPRPAVFAKVDPLTLKSLISKIDGVVLLTHDDNVSRLKELYNYQLIYGIREAKGLEFQAVILVDFLKELPTSIQKQFRDIMLDREHFEVSIDFPEIEGYLKLLYTGITRCIQRLFFAETSKSEAGNAFVRLITTKDGLDLSKDALAVKSSVENVEKMVRSPDEWYSAGLDNAVMAESTTDPSESIDWLNKALFCFESAGGGDNNFFRRARIHRSSAEFRLEIQEGRLDTKDESNEIEMKTAQLVQQLLEERLFLEVKRLIDIAMPLQSNYTRDALLKHFQFLLPQLRSMEM